MRSSSTPDAAALLLLLAAGAAAAAAGSPAIESLPRDWQVVHCGMARGVLYVTYTRGDHADITPAFATAAIAKACSAAGYPLAEGGPVRQPNAVIAPSSPARRPASVPAAAVNRNEPSFIPLALGSTITIDARNDSDVTWRCQIEFGYVADGDATGPRTGRAQATLPPHQSQRVVSLTGSGGSLRLAGLPRPLCSALP